MSAATIQPTTHSTNAGLSSPHPSETHQGADVQIAGEREYLVTSFQRLKGGDLYAVVLRVGVAQPIEWVRANAEEIAKVGIARDSLARKLSSPIVAMNVEQA